MSAIDGSIVYDLEHLTLRQMTLGGAALRTRRHSAGSVQDVCRRIVQHFYDHLLRSEARACEAAGRKRQPLTGVPVAPYAAELFRPLALSRLSILPLAAGPIFETADA